MDKLKLIVKMVFPSKLTAAEIHLALLKPYIVECMKRNSIFSKIFDSRYVVNPADTLPVDLLDPHVHINDIIVNNEGIYAELSGLEHYIRFLNEFKSVNPEAVNVIPYMINQPEISESCYKIISFVTYYGRNVSPQTYLRNKEHAKELLDILGKKETSPLSVETFSYRKYMEELTDDNESSI